MEEPMPNGQSRPHTTVVVMAFNEEESLERVVTEILDEADSAEICVEIDIIDDGSTDGTSEIASRLADSLKWVRHLRHDQNGGLGQVYRTGFESARGQWLSFLPADGQIPARDLHGFWAKQHEYDLILGFIPDRPVPLYVKALSLGERFLYRILFGGFPRFQGILLVRTDAVRQLSLVSEGRGWTIVMEMILRIQRAGLRVGHSPTTLRDRMAGESKVNNLQTIMSNLKQMAELRRKL